MTAYRPTTKFGNTFAHRKGVSNDASAWSETLGDIQYDSINRRLFAEQIEFNRFYTIIRDFIKARLGHPVVRVELSDFQILTAIDEAIAKLDYHAPDWCLQFMTFHTKAGENLYELPQFVMNNFRFAAYKKTLLSVARQSNTLENDFFIKYFQENFLFNQLDIGEFLLMKMQLEQIRKVLSREGTWSVVNGKYLAVWPVPSDEQDQEEVAVEFKALDTNTLHPYFVGWIQRFGAAVCKVILGQIRGKFAQLPSPQGGATLNGPALVQEGNAEQEKLVQELLNEIEEPPVFTTF
jgi:hypothetical protein|tara:strand:- start:657 stop:1535 length:879 start_codon:yes stop_codon:yes gene_type:complete